MSNGLSITIVALFLIYAMACAPIGSFADEEEKIAVGVFASEGFMPYRDILLNHGPLPFLIACAGYKLGGSIGALTALRILPISLALFSILSLRTRTIFKSERHAFAAKATWATILMMLWSQGTLRMGIYHGCGGLAACILIGEYLIPSQVGDIPTRKSILGAASVAALMTTLSLTFIPFCTIAIAALFTARPNSNSNSNYINKKIRARIAPSATSDIARKAFQIIGPATALSPLAALALLAALGLVTARGYYLGHIYFNLKIFAQIGNAFGDTSTLNLATWSAPSFALAVGVAIIPSIATSYSAIDLRTCSKRIHGTASYIGLRPLRDGFKASSTSAILTSLAIFSLSYRIAIWNPGDFHSLPYLLPAIYVNVAYTLHLAEQASLPHIGAPIRGPSKCHLSILCWASTLLSIGTTALFRTFGTTSIDSGQELHFSIRSLVQELPNKDRLIIEMIHAIENSTGTRSSIFAWPFKPWVYTQFGRSSPIGLTWFLWYNERVEKDKELAKYHACAKPSTQYPDLIFYERWLVGEHDSEQYGKCLIALQNKHYDLILPGIYLNKSHRKIYDELTRKPTHELAFLSPAWNDSDPKATLTPVPLPKNGKLDLRVRSTSVAEDGALYIMVGTHGRTNRGHIITCIHGKRENRGCSKLINKEYLEDNSITKISLPLLRAHPKRAMINIQIIDTTPYNTGRNDNRIAIYLLSNQSRRKGAPEAATWIK